MTIIMKRPFSIAYIFSRKLLFIACFFFVSVRAQSDIFKGFYGYLYMGDNIVNSNSDVLKSVNYKGGGPFEWGIGVGKYLNGLLSLEGTFEYYGERYERRDGPILLGTLNNIIQAGGIGLSMSALLNYNWNSFHIYSGFGAGYFSAGLLVTDPQSGLLTVENAPSDKWLPGFHIIAGIDYKFAKSFGLGIEIKHRILRTDFGNYTNGEVDFGGTWLLIIFRLYGDDFANVQKF